MQPQPVVARLSQVDPDRSGEEDEPDQDAHDRGPAASVRDQIGNEEVCRRSHEEDEEREPEHGEREGGGDERQKLEEEPGEIEAGEDDDRDHGRQGEQPRRDPVPREERPEREHEADRHRDQGEQDEPRDAAVACEHAEQRARREENRDAAEVGEEDAPDQGMRAAVLTARRMARPPDGAASCRNRGPRGRARPARGPACPSGRPGRAPSWSA